MRFNDFKNITGFDFFVPNTIRINDYGWAAMVLLRTTGFGNKKIILKIPFGNFVAEHLQQFQPAFFGAMSGFFVGANQNVFFEGNHEKRKSKRLLFCPVFSATPIDEKKKD